MGRIALSPMTLYTNSASVALVFPATPWFNAADAEMMRESLELLNTPAAGAIEVTVGYQLADTVNVITSTNSLATMRNSDGLTFPAAFVDYTATTGGKQLIRGVYLAKNKTGGGTTAQFCWASAIIETKLK